MYRVKPESPCMTLQFCLESSVFLASAHVDGVVALYNLPRGEVAVSHDDPELRSLSISADRMLVATAQGLKLAKNGRDIILAGALQTGPTMPLGVQGIPRSLAQTWLVARRLPEREREREIAFEGGREKCQWVPWPIESS
eukprot:5693206-Amphidinium_carterae.1